MVSPTSRWTLAVLAAVLLAAGCGGGDPETAATTSSTRATSTTSSTSTTVVVTTAPAAPLTTAAPATTRAPVTVAPAPTTTLPATTTSTHPHPERQLYDQAWTPYATVGPVTLHHPANRVEAIGFHQSGHDGAQAQMVAATAARWFVMEDRERDTIDRGAADIVVEPGREIRAPVTGTVIRAGTYTLYCDHVDQYAVIEPDARPGWEVKVLHIEGLALSKGQRVEAGVTRLAAHARILPFPSQVEEDTGLPPWPHVHVEVVDPAIKDRPGEPCP